MGSNQLITWARSERDGGVSNKLATGVVYTTIIVFKAAGSILSRFKSSKHDYNQQDEEKNNNKRDARYDNDTNGRGGK